MGIDIYAKWYRMTAAERKAQYTGFDTTAGSVGYLREAYHGGPYATRALVPESFAAKRSTAAIPAATLRGRLPGVVTLVLMREATLYEDGEARAFLLREVNMEAAVDTAVRDGDMSTFLPRLTQIFAEEIPKATGEQPSVPQLTDAQIQEAVQRFPVVRSFVAFVELVERKERETGRPVRILASY